MRKIVNILLITFILLLFNFTKNTNVLTLTISFSMFLLFSGLFSTTSIKEVVGEYHSKKLFYSRDRLFYYSMVAIIFISIVLMGISYLVGDILNIKGLSVVNMVMSMSLLCNVLLKIISEYLEILGYKKISNSLVNLYRMVTLSILIVLVILLFRVFELDNYINFIILYSVPVVMFVFVIVTIYLIIFRKKKKYNRRSNENNVKYISKIKGVIVNNQMKTILNIINSTYIYFSVIVLYYVLFNKYNYDYNLVDVFISNTYFYGLVVIYFVYILIWKFLNINYDNVKDSFNSNINKIIKVLFNLCVLLIVISMPLNNLLLISEYNAIIGLVLLLVFFIFYIYIMNINIKYGKNKVTLITMIIGLVVKIVFELPFINAFYRMGYTMVLGSVFASVMGFVVSIILGIIFIKHKFKINLLGNFNNILNIVYEGIIYTLVMVLFSLIIKVDNSGVLNNILVIIFYIFITVLFHIVERILVRK